MLGHTANISRLRIRDDTRTKKLEKRYTPFSYKHTIGASLFALFEQFRDSRIVLSYSSNAVPDAKTIERMLKEVKHRVDVVAVDHGYSFGTHERATRRSATEYIFVA